MKTICIYHSIDLDGWMSAANVIRWFRDTNRHCEIKDLDKDHFYWMSNHVETMQLDLKGYNYGDPIPDLSGYRQVIMVDISFPKDVMWAIHRDTIGNLIWNDHHISAIKDMDTIDPEQKLLYGEIKGLRDTKLAACELTWNYFFPLNEMPELVRLLGRYDCFGHKGTAEEKDVLKFQYGARAFISDWRQAYDYLQAACAGEDKSVVEGILSHGISIYKFLCTDALQSYKNGFPVVFDLDPEYRTGKTVKFICINKERFNPINFDIDYHADGYDGAACFHYANGEYNFSLYNDNGKVDCSTIAKQFGGGGHKGASGFRIKDLKQIL